MNVQLESDARIAIDLGAESGRVVLIWLTHSCSRFAMEEVHRFPNRTLLLPSGLHWDIGNIWSEILGGLRAAARYAAEHKLAIRSVGVDSWGVDWALLDQNSELLGLPHAYRDPRNVAAFDRVSQKITPEATYRITGIQVMPINSLYSLAAMESASKQMVATAHHLLFIPDLLHYWLCGHHACELTIASTSQMLEAKTGKWSCELMNVAGVPNDCFLPVTQPGSTIGTLREEICEVTGLANDVRVILPGSHDTASAVASVPANSDSSWCFLSSGTWSLLGAEIQEPCLSATAASHMFTNEAGIANTIRFLKNISGLWLIQQCRQQYALQNGQPELPYDEVVELAKTAEAFRTIVDPDDPPFGSPGHTLEKIDAFARRTRQPVPSSPGQYYRCCFESLALAYRRTLQLLESILEQRFDTIHVVGGGCQNRFLCQLTADATGRSVVAGPVEATAIGNGLVQAMGDGQISGLDGIRQIVRATVSPLVYNPASDKKWEEQFARFEKLISG